MRARARLLRQTGRTRAPRPGGTSARCRTSNQKTWRGQPSQSCSACAQIRACSLSGKVIKKRGGSGSAPGQHVRHCDRHGRRQRADVWQHEAPLDPTTEEPRHLKRRDKKPGQTRKPTRRPGTAVNHRARVAPVCPICVRTSRELSTFVYVPLSPIQPVSIQL